MPNVVKLCKKAMAYVHFFFNFLLQLLFEGSLQCPKPAKLVKAVWQMYSESRKLFKFECTNRLACEKGKI